MSDKKSDKNKELEITIEPGEEHAVSPMKHLMVKHGITEAQARQAVSDINTEARINQLENRLATIQLIAREEKPKWKYFIGGGSSDSLRGAITKETGFDIDEFLIELWVVAQYHRFDIPGLHKLVVDCGIIAYLAIDKIEKLEASANSTICQDVHEFRVRRIR